MTARVASSTVVKRRPHSWQLRRRRMTWPSSCSRESTTRESGWRQYGQRTDGLLSVSTGAFTMILWTNLSIRGAQHVDHNACPVDYVPLPVDNLHLCNY